MNDGHGLHHDAWFLLLQSLGRGAPPGRLDVETIDVGAILWRRKDPVQLFYLLVVGAVLRDEVLELFEVQELESELQEVDGFVVLAGVGLQNASHESMWEEES